MSKTPEQMAEEWANAESDLWFADISTYTDGHKSAVKQAYLAGYQAAINSPKKPDSCEHILDMEKMVDADKVKFCVYCNDMHKGNCAVGKGKNHPAFGFSEIVVKIESSWVSVKDRLPECSTGVLIYVNFQAHNITFRYYTVALFNGTSWDDNSRNFVTHWMSPPIVTHWMPLPKPPEEGL